MQTCQSANQLKTPAKVSWALKMVSQFGSLGYTIIGKTADLLLFWSCRQRHLTWAKEKKNWTVAQWSKVLFSDESKFCISFGHQGPRFWRKGGEAHSPIAWSPVKFPQSVMIWCAMSSAGVGPLCFFENQHHCTRLPRHFGALHASFCWF